jgi:hypothetical protein
VILPICNANFKEGDTLDIYLLPDEVANAVKLMITDREGLVMTEITLSLSSPPSKK